MKDLLIRTITGVSIVILVVTAILTGPLPFLGLNMVIFTLGIVELYRLCLRERSAVKHLGTAISSGLMLPVSYMVLQHHWSPLFFLIPVGGWIAGLFWSGRPGVDLLGLLWIAVPLSSFYTLGYAFEKGRYHPLLPLAVIVLVWINDTFAYLAGSGLGRHTMTLRLSPGKTWEGFAGGVLVTLLGGYVTARVTGVYTPAGWIILSLLVCLLGLAGDLFESGLKRRNEVKDTGGILPGHGGILDRFDSLLFVTPVLLLIVILAGNSL